MRHVNLATMVCAVLVVLTFPSRGLGTVELTVSQVGFPTLTAGPVVRNGAWVPVIVDLDLIDQLSFDGSLRIAQFDNDGDVCFDLVDVHLRADSGGNRTSTLYVPANPTRGQGKLFVELLNEQGDAVEVLAQGELTYRATPAQQPAVILDDNILILSISAGTIGRVQDLVTLNKVGKYIRQLYVAHVSPTHLPELWIGLEAVDYIVWDDARPEDLTERQLNALLDWVRRGGTLLIAASRSASSLVLAKPLDAVLPVEVGELIAVDNLREVRRKLVAEPPDTESFSDLHWLDVGFKTQIPLVKCTVREGAAIIASEDSLEAHVFTRRREGRGYVVFSAVTLKDLCSAPGDASRLFEKLFYLRTRNDPDVSRPLPVSLFAEVARVTSFSSKGGLYLFISGTASIAYVILATFGSWGFLTAKGWRRFSWNAFALVALAAGVLSVVAVRSRHGFADTLHQISVVDADADSLFGHATVLFGLKTSVNKKLDVWLPSDRRGAVDPGTTTCFLRSLSGPGDVVEAKTGFADPQEYRIIPASAAINDVPIRATLKQFEGRWSGLLDGVVSGEVFVRSRRIARDSYIVNELGVDLVGCWLLQPVIDATIQGSRSSFIYAYEIGNLPANGARIMLQPLCPRLVPGQELAEAMRQSTLTERQKAWGSLFRELVSSLGLGSDTGPAAAPLGAERKALLLLSTAGEHDPEQDTDVLTYFGRSRRTWSRDRLRGIDLSDRLDTDSVILLGFADEPGPARLFRRTGDRPYRPLEPDPNYSKTMYRIRLPVTHLGGRRAEPVTDDKEVLGLEMGSSGLEDR